MMTDTGTEATGTLTHQYARCRRRTQPLHLAGNCTAQRRAKARAWRTLKNAATTTNPLSERPDERTHHF